MVSLGMSYRYFFNNIHILKLYSFHLEIKLIFKIIGSFLTTILNIEKAKKVNEILTRLM
jgi:hypothetical protein